MGDNRHNSNGKWNTFGTSSRDKARPSLMQVPRRQVPKTPKVNNHSLLSNMPPRWIPPKERLKQQEAARKGKQPEQG